jgi:hypothetical protein
MVRVRVRIGGKHAGIRSPDRRPSYATTITIQEKTGQSGAQLTRVRQIGRAVIADDVNRMTQSGNLPNN